MLKDSKARDELEEILKEREYQAYYDDSKGLISIWWEKVKDWFADLLADLFPSFAPSSAAAGPILIGIIVIMIISLGVIAFFIFRNRKRNRMLHDHKPLQSMNEMNWSFQRHLSESQKHEANGEYTLATRHLFLALLLYFHEKEWLVARIWKTNWEYYDELRKVNQEWADQFYHLARLFDEVTYGKHNIQIEEFLQFRITAMKWLENSEEIREFGVERR
ncbi:DUF4129 domain-containing protein [Cytobacillus solani]|uniref:Protein-glutamine gamma-glutamyltransferase-like C-terminal domain-containing protein n=1 Tax=Cytobacillus solani TaxID=1637975 RepID=A0A0Q3T7N6_9BACI|nr:DUF4129 domain-containing protein [Cytobacillus solani]KOP82514.1 hypothetical protein AMS60_08510 [Bacillus sp. FJAT-21945]KQL19525.1 hypothetical protein AN957_13780 [Cytobacillus solani]USK52749.1 DUF4129 domain-containing protein [Cytobacillus solani]